MIKEEERGRKKINKIVECQYELCLSVSVSGVYAIFCASYFFFVFCAAVLIFFSSPHEPASLVGLMLWLSHQSLEFWLQLLV